MSHPPVSRTRSSVTLWRTIRRHTLAILLDALIVTASLFLAWSARAITATLDIRPAFIFSVAAIAVCCATNYLFRLYHRIWRYASAGEIVVIAAAVATSTVLLTLTDLLWSGRRPVPLSVVWMMGFFAFVGFVSIRYRRRVWTGFLWRWRALRGQFPSTRTRVLIVGAGEAGQLLAWRFQNQKEGEGYKLVGFVDDDPEKQGMRVHGIPVLGNRHDIPQLAARHQIGLIIIAIYNISGDDFRAILDACEKTSAAIKILPNIFDFIRSTNGLPPIRDITIEDLLGRKPVKIDHDACLNLLSGKTILVTGAAGSIGSELCRQILTFTPRQLIMLDNNESGLYDLVSTLEIHRSKQPQTEHPNIQCATPVIADITNRAKMQVIFETYQPEIVFHAAAYKHVPLMEAYPDEAVRVNVLGTRILAELAARYGAERFVLISTDKAVNPCSVMGTTKWLCEMLIANDMRKGGEAEENGQWSAVSSQPTLFTAVRFGNVLGSRGSVVPIFERQIERGGPITITHPEMTRYFMSIPEAVSLVIQAAVFTEGGDIFMLDMGQRIRIEDLARRLIRLRGLRPDIDIPIVYTGPRPGEKMHEELLAEDEERYSTPHPHIFRVRPRHTPDYSALQYQIDELIDLAKTQQNNELIKRLHSLVREKHYNLSPSTNPSGSTSSSSSRPSWTR